MRVFLSHTSELARFPEGRSFVAAAQRSVNQAGHTPVDMEYFGAEAAPPASVCRERVSSCQVYVGLIGFRYGSLVRGRTDVSYTELEFNTATELGLPRLVFFLDDRAEVPIADFQDTRYGDRQEAFRRRIQDEDVTVARFRRPEDLESGVLQALLRLAPGLTGPSSERRSRGPWMVPSRSSRFVDRPDVMAGLVRTVVAHRPDAGPVALQGTGGFGKTTLAEELCRRAEVAARFPDGILWVTVGQLTSDAALAAKINDLSLELAGDRPTFSDPEPAGFHLGGLLHTGSRMLVIDDVWEYVHLRPFLFDASGCLRLVTTRNRSALPDDAHLVAVDAMETDEARQLLLSGLGEVPEPTVETLIRLTGRWPVLLGLANGTARAYVAGGEGVPEALGRVVRWLRQRGPATFDVASPDDRRRAVAATVGASLNLLGPHELERYLELAVFPEDIEIPSSVLALYWRASGGLDDLDVDRLCRRLTDLSLVMHYRHSPSRIRLHDVIRSYLRSHYQDRLVAMNRTLLDSVRATLPDGAAPTPWWLLPPEEQYLWHALSFHLVEAGLTDELHDLVHDLRYLVRKILLLGTVAAETDLVLTADPLSEAIRRVVAQDAHLLEAAGSETELAATLLNRLDSVPGTAGVAEDFVGATATSYFRNRWPPPDLPDPALRRVIEGHTGTIYACAIEPNGTWLATGGADASVRLWDVATGRLRRVLQGHQETVWRCVVSPDGSWLASVDDGGWLRTWDVAAGAVRGATRISDHPVFGCAIAPDGTWIATVGDDGPVRLWDAASLEFRGQLEGHHEQVWGGCAVSPDGRLLATGSSDGTVRIWEVESGRIHRVLEHPTVAWGCSFSADGRQLVTARSEGRVVVWDVETGSVVLDLDGHEGPVHACMLSADGAWLISAGSDGTLRIRDGRTGVLLRMLEGSTEPVWACAVAADSTWLATAGSDSTVRIWALSAAADAPLPVRRTRRVWASAAPADQAWLATAGDDGTVLVWDVETGRPLHQLAGHSGPVWTCATPASGRWLATAGGDGVAIVWDMTTATMRHVLEGHRGPIWSCSAPAGGDWLATAGEDGLVRIWDARSGRLRRQLEDHAGPVHAVAAADAGDWVATAGPDGRVRVWDSEDGTLRQLLQDRSAPVWTCACVNGSWLAAAGEDGVVRVWDVATGQLRRSLTGHDGPVWASAASFSDGSLLATTGRDRTVRVWLPAAGDACATSVRLGRPARDCCWVGAGDHLDLCVGGDAGTYLLTRVPGGTEEP